MNLQETLLRLTELQKEREKKCHKDAVNRLHETVEKDRLNVNAGSSVWGIALRNDYLAKMIEVLEQEIKTLETQPQEHATNKIKVLHKCMGIKINRSKDKEEATTPINLWSNALACHVTLLACLDNACSPQIPKTGSSTDKQKEHKYSKKDLQTFIADQIYKQMKFNLVEINFNRWMESAKRQALQEHCGSSPIHAQDRLMKSIDGFWSNMMIAGDDTRAAGLYLDGWSYEEKQVIGSWMIKIAFTLGIFDVDKNATDRDGKTCEQLVLSKSGEGLRDSYLESAEAWCFDAIPMLVQPKDITAKELGGWLTDAAGEPERVADTWKGKIELSDKHVAFFNHQQKQSFRINRFVFDMVNELKERNLQIGKWKFYDIDKDQSNQPIHRRLDIPDAVYYNATPQEQKAMLSADEKRFTQAKRDKTKAHRLQQKKKEDGLRSDRLLRIAKQCLDDEQFYIPISADFRGRYYPRVAFLSYQSGDSGRAMLEFGKPYEIDQTTKHYLSIHLANCAGQDKESFDDRLLWVHENQYHIKAIGNILNDWDTGWKSLQEFADEDALQLAAACHEYVELFINKSRTETYLPISVDATCSGQQIIAGQLRSPEIANMVNVTPTLKPNSLYRFVMDRFISLTPHSPLGNLHGSLKKLKSKLGTKLSKAACMSAQYGSALSRQILDMEIKAKELGLKLRPEEWALFVGRTPKKDQPLKVTALYKDAQENSVWLTALNRETKIDETFKWLGNTAARAFKAGVTELKIPLPSGSCIKMRYNDRDTKTVETFHYGSSKYKKPRANVKVTKEHKPLLSKWKSSCGANAIHGYDSSLLCIALSDFEYSFYGCHDSISTYAGKPMETLHKRLREAYVEVSNHSLWDTILEANGLEPDPSDPHPFTGGLDINLALESPYLFC